MLPCLGKLHTGQGFGNTAGWEGCCSAASSPPAACRFHWHQLPARCPTAVLIRAEQTSASGANRAGRCEHTGRKPGLSVRWVVESALEHGPGRALLHRRLLHRQNHRTRCSEERAVVLVKAQKEQSARQRACCAGTQDFRKESCPPSPRPRPRVPEPASVFAACLPSVSKLGSSALGFLLARAALAG